jgi:hypothetical protein
MTARVIARSRACYNSKKETRIGHDKRDYSFGIVLDASRLRELNKT